MPIEQERCHIGDDRIARGWLATAANRIVILALAIAGGIGMAFVIKSGGDKQTGGSVTVLGQFTEVGQPPEPAGYRNGAPTYVSDNVFGHSVAIGVFPMDSSRGVVVGRALPGAHGRSGVVRVSGLGLVDDSGAVTIDWPAVETKARSEDKDLEWGIAVALIAVRDKTYVGAKQ